MTRPRRLPPASVADRRSHRCRWRTGVRGVAFGLCAATLLPDAGACPGQQADQRGMRNPQSRLRRADDAVALDWGDGCDTGAIETTAEPFERRFADGFDPDQVAANASRVRFSGSAAVQATSSSMRMPP